MGVREEREPTILGRGAPALPSLHPPSLLKGLTWHQVDTVGVIRVQAVDLQPLCHLPDLAGGLAFGAQVPAVSGHPGLET